jgi:hypothetical protein
MGRKYQRQDGEVIDYDLWGLPEAPDLLRGPRVNTLGASDPNYISYVGAAQTFGTFCKHPYPNLLSEILGVESLNLGFGGAGPKLFLNNEELFPVINKSRCVVVQVMAARSAANSMMVNPRGGGAFRWRTDPESAPLRHSEVLYQELLERESDARVLEIVEETRERYIQDFKLLRERIARPCILLWMSKRDPEYSISVKNVQALYGGFPQLVNQRTLSRVSEMFDEVVVSTCNKGFPVPLVSRFSGRPVVVRRDRDVLKKNLYYPSQQQHIQAALDLLPVMKKVLGEE